MTIAGNQENGNKGCHHVPWRTNQLHTELTEVGMGELEKEGRKGSQATDRKVAGERTRQRVL